MTDYKHVGRIRVTGRKVLVAYRTLPSDPYHALVIQTESLGPEQHDSIIKIVESSAGQSAYELAEVLARSRFPDGSVMLAALHVQGRLTKVPTKDIDMVPNSRVTVPLDELNRMIAEQRGVGIEDLAVKPVDSREVATINELNTVNAPTPPDTALSDADLARKYRSDALRLSKEAAALRRMADQLAPSKKTGPKKKGE